MPLRKTETPKSKGLATRTAKPSSSAPKASKDTLSNNPTASLSNATATLSGAVSETQISDAAILGFTPGQLKGDPMTAHQNAAKAGDREAALAIAEWGKVVNWQRVKQSQLEAIREEFVTVKAGARAVSAGYDALSAIEGTKQSVIEFRTQVEKTSQKLDTLGLETFRTTENRKQVESSKKELTFNTEQSMHKASIAQQKALEMKAKAESLTTMSRPA